jgi:ABC-2 type transport system permease protein
MSLADVRAYVWLSQAILLLGMMGVDAEVAALIRSGNVTSDLTRPVDLHGWWLARVAAGRATPTMLRALPILAIGALLGDLHRPPSPQALLLVGPSLLLALLLGSSLYTLVTTSLLCTQFRYRHSLYRLLGNTTRCGK